MKKSKIKTGDKVKTTQHIAYDGVTIQPGEYTVATMLKSGDGKNVTHYGIVSELAFMDWGDLNGACPPGHGIWLAADYFFKYFAFSDFGKKLQIGGEFIFKRKDLKGKSCRLLSRLPNSKVAFVEFDEDVGGCSGDGLGKAGHCVLVPNKILQKSK